MVNILDHWPELEEIPENHQISWDEMYTFRKQVFEGFLALEIEAGTCPEHRSLSMKDGQDYVRSLCFRILEELSEAHDSVEQDHFLEELIDAFNYLMAVVMFDKDLFTVQEVSETLYHNSLLVFGTTLEEHQAEDRYTFKSDIGNTTITLGLWADTLRNRSWMKEAQSVQFVGKEATRRMLAVIAQTIFKHFNSWDEFWQYYIAKNRVLKFRLESNY